MVYFNNKNKWEANILLSNKKIAASNEEGSGKKGGREHKKRKKGGTKQTLVDDDEGELPCVVRRRWADQRKIRSGGHGYSAQGKAFYTKMCVIFGKTIRTDEWEEVWTKYWNEEMMNYIVPKNKDEPLWNAVPEESNGENGCCDLFDDDDDSDNQSHAGGIAMEAI